MGSVVKFQALSTSIFVALAFSVSGCASLGVPQQSAWNPSCLGPTVFGVKHDGKERNVTTLNEDPGNLALTLKGYVLVGRVAICEPQVSDMNMLAEKYKYKYAPETLTPPSIQQAVQALKGYEGDLIVFKGARIADHKFQRVTYTPSETYVTSTTPALCPGCAETSTYSSTVGGSDVDESGENYSSKDTIYYVWEYDPDGAKQQAVAFAAIEGNTSVLKKFLSEGIKLDVQKPFTIKYPYQTLEGKYIDLEWQKPELEDDIRETSIVTRGFYSGENKWGEHKGTISMPYLGDTHSLLEYAVIYGQLDAVKLILANGGSREIEQYKAEYRSEVVKKLVSESPPNVRERLKRILNPYVQ
ncbi:MAG TPA: hypothetical protein VNI58_02500 [Mariprofundaceae bacterium]|nr:hypothetical protein [Mariprofundaceae bacterium]